MAVIPGWRRVAGHSLLALGVAGVLLPVVPGMPLLIAAYAILGPEDRSIRWGLRCYKAIRQGVQEFRRLSFSREKAAGAAGTTSGEELRALLPALVPWADFVHYVPGRLRIRVPHIRGDLRQSGLLERSLRLMPGVDSVTISMTTGSILVSYNSRRTDPAALLDALGLVLAGRPLQRIEEPASPRERENRSVTES
jgi:copper chaperone CopZ